MKSFKHLTFVVLDWEGRHVNEDEVGFSRILLDQPVKAGSFVDFLKKSYSYFSGGTNKCGSENHLRVKARKAAQTSFPYVRYKESA